MKTIGELKAEMEEKYGKPIEEIAAEVMLEDLTPAEFIVIQVIVNLNHKQALDMHRDELDELNAAVFTEAPDYEGPAYS